MSDKENAAVASLYGPWNFERRLLIFVAAFGSCAANLDHTRLLKDSGSKRKCDSV